MSNGEPKVCALLLTADRQQYTDRAVACFLRQTYREKKLLILDTGSTRYDGPGDDRITTVYLPELQGKTIGELRNRAGSMSAGADILMHWDSDDWSAPSRMSLQVANLAANGDATGLETMLFWDATAREAWFYKGKLVGTSLCYWRKSWEAKPFPSTSAGEDTIWARGQRIATVPDVTQSMIAEVHGSNTHCRITRDHPQWTRVKSWDGYCRRHSLEAFMQGRAGKL